MQVTQGHARLAARAYAVCIVLLGIVPLAVMAFLISAFGFYSVDWKLIVFVVVPGLLFIFLGLFVWRQKKWAMLAGLALAVAFRFVLGDPNPALGIVLIAAPVLFAMFTAIFLMSGGH